MQLCTLLTLAGCKALETPIEEFRLGLPSEPRLQSGVTPGFDRLGLQVLSELEQDENLFYSPYSLSRALALVALGASGETKRELLLFLGLEDLESVKDVLFRELTVSPEITLREANAIWYDQSITLLDSYQETLSNEFRATIEKMALKQEPEASAKQINSWVSEQTEGTINKILEPSSLSSPPMEWVLTNAIYFFGQWQHTFKKEETKLSPFYSTSQKYELPTMQKREVLPYAQSDRLEVIEIPYWGEEFAMVIYLPSKGVTLSEISKNLRLEDWRSRLRYTRVELRLPKFRIEASYSFADILRESGLPIALGPDADFSGISQKAVAIGKIEQKTFVEVTEVGTEAAAVTTVSGTLGLKGEEAPVKWKLVEVNRPFLFTIEHTSTNTLLFLGRFHNPME